MQERKINGFRNKTLPSESPVVYHFENYNLFPLIPQIEYTQI